MPIKTGSQDTGDQGAHKGLSWYFIVTLLHV